MAASQKVSARYTLTDGTTVEGKPRFSWPWSRYYRLLEPVFYDSRTTEPIPAAGTLHIAKRAVILIQIGD